MPVLVEGNQSVAQTISKIQQETHEKAMEKHMEMLRQSGVPATQTLCSPYTTDLQSLYSEYTGCADWRMPVFGGKS